MTYSAEQLKAMCPAQISECSQKHVQSVIEELIETALAQPAQAVMAPEYAAAVRELAEQSDMSEAQVLRAAVRLYQAEQKGLVMVEHKEQIGPLAAPQPEAQPPIGFFAFDPDNGVEFFKTMQEAEQYAAQALEVYREAAKFDGEWIDDVEAVRVGIVTQRAAAVEYEEGTDYEMRPAAPSAQAEQGGK